jgi:hypothetical protein
MSPSENLLVVNSGPAGLSISLLRHCATTSSLVVLVWFFIAIFLSKINNSVSSFFYLFWLSGSRERNQHGVEMCHSWTDSPLKTTTTLARPASTTAPAFAKLRLGRQVGEGSLIHIAAPRSDRGSPRDKPGKDRSRSRLQSRREDLRLPSRRGKSCPPLATRQANRPRRFRE